MSIVLCVLVNGIIPISAFDKWLALHCPKGYYGYHCNINCPYPNYGEHCSQICDCLEQNCNNIQGCPAPSKICPAGYLGKYCETECRFPSYGLFCQKQCPCSETQCNFILGCRNKTHHLENLTPGPTASYSNRITEGKDKEAHTIHFHSLTSTNYLVTVDYATVTNKTITAKLYNQRSKDDWLTASMYGTAALLIILVLLHISISFVRCVKVKGTRKDVEQSSST